MSRCEQELCRNWGGGGCVCSLLEIDPDVVREHECEEDL